MILSLSKKLAMCITSILCVIAILISFLHPKIKKSETLFPCDQCCTSSDKIFLYGEFHSNKSNLEREFELWSSYYHNDGMRDLFVELPYYTAEYMNIWMRSDNDDILYSIFHDMEGTLGNSQESFNFYKYIKNECPETIFHGTDVGHQYNTTGKRFLGYLESIGQTQSNSYKLAQENIMQGEYYYRNSPNSYDVTYRENTMVENFIREFNDLNGISIMGIYGSAHTNKKEMNYTKTVPCMANQLYQKYGDRLYTKDLNSFWDKIKIHLKDTLKHIFKKKSKSILQEDNIKKELPISKKYCLNFEEVNSNSVIVQKTSENDKDVLKNLILNEGKNFARYLGNGLDTTNPDDLLITDEGILSLTIKDIQKNIVGQVILSKGSCGKQLNVGYWVGKDFRGKGYTSLAVANVISKIWEMDRSIAFEFWIDDTNIASIKTVEKICRNLNANLKKGEQHTTKLRLINYNDEQLNYNLQTYFDGVLINELIVSKDKLLENFSKESVESGILSNVACTTYLIENKFN